MSPHLLPAWADKSGVNGHASPRTAARVLAAFAASAGVMSIINGLTTFRRIPSVNVPLAVAGGAIACLIGMAVWVLPWHRFHPRATLSLVPVCYSFMSVSVMLGNRESLVYVSFVYIVPYVFIAVWTGIAHPRYTYTRFLPITVTTFTLPLVLAGGPYLSVALASVMFVIPTCVLLAELVAWLVHRLSTLSTSLETTTNELQLSEARYRTLVDNGRDVVLVLDRDGIIRFVSANAEREFGLAPDHVVGLNPLQITEATDHHTLLGVFADLAKNRCEEGFAGPIWATFVNPRSNDRRPIEIFAKNLLVDANVQGIVVTVRDITERRERESALAAEARRDPLTKLLNRRAFNEQLAGFLASTTPRGAVLFLDVDGFKGVNDEHGHHIGDAALVEVANRLRGALRSTDALARYGGDEFVVLLSNLQRDEEVESIAHELRATMREPLVCAGIELCLGVSIGQALIGPDARDATELIRRADASMFEAKTRSRALSSER